MKNINWKVRFKNKTFLLTFLTTVVAFIYQLLGMFDVVPSIAKETIMELLGAMITALIGLGIVIDPTTRGVKDCEEVLDKDYTDEP